MYEVRDDGGKYGEPEFRVIENSDTGEFIRVLCYGHDAEKISKWGNAIERLTREVHENPDDELFHEIHDRQLACTARAIVSRLEQEATNGA